MAYKYRVVDGLIVWDEAPAFINQNGEINELNPVYSGIISGLVSVGATVVAGASYKLSFLLNPYVQNTVSQVIVEEINFEVLGKEGDILTVSIGGVVQVVESVVLGEALASALAMRLGLAAASSLPLWGIFATAVASTAIISSSFLAGALITEAVVNGAWNLAPLDFRYHDENSNHTDGLFYPTGLGGAPESNAILEFIGKQNDNLGNGTFQMYRGTEGSPLLEWLPLGDEYEIYKADFLNRIVASLDNLTEFRQLYNVQDSSGNVYVNPITPNADDTPYLYFYSGTGLNFTDADLKVFVPVTAGGVTKVVEINNFYDGEFAAANKLFGDGDGNNFIIAVNGGVTINGGDGDDIIIGGTGNDSIYGSVGNDIIFGNAEDDTLNGGIGSNILVGGAGNNTADYRIIPADLTINLLSGTAIGSNLFFSINDELYDIQNVIAHTGDDFITGNDLANKLEGGDGDDTIEGLGGDDIVNAGAGNDTIVGGAGLDTYDGGENSILPDNDLIDYSKFDASTEGASGLQIDLAAGRTFLIKGETLELKDTITNFESATGTAGNDRIFGNDDDNELIGGGGNDLLFGDSGFDTYHFSDTGFGDDIISDDGGKIVIDKTTTDPVTGEITVTSTKLSGKAVYNGSYYEITNSSGTYHLSGDGEGGPLEITRVGNPAGDKITISSFYNKGFGFYLEDKPTSDIPNDGVNPNSSPPPPEGGNPPPPPEGGGWVPTFKMNDDQASAAGFFGMSLLSPSFNGTGHDPLVFDLNNNGMADLISLQNSNIYFDLDGDGLAERSGWVAPGDGLLVMDRDGNGAIEGIDELFGNTTTSGLVELAELDSNADGVITSADAQFADLKMWQDANSNAISEVEELKTLDELGISSISLNGIAANEAYQGNIVIENGTYISNGVENKLFDVVLLADNFFSLSQPAGSSNTILAETLFLPFSRGYGDLKAWHYAMTDDATLLTMMKGFVANDNKLLKLAA